MGRLSPARFPADVEDLVRSLGTPLGSDSEDNALRASADPTISDHTETVSSIIPYWIHGGCIETVFWELGASFRRCLPVDKGAYICIVANLFIRTPRHSENEP
jgi:hypothetical protein